MYHVSRYSQSGQVSTTDTELAQLASEGFARLLADSGHTLNHHTRTGHGGGETSKVVEVIHTLEPLPLPAPVHIKACTELVRIAIALHLGLLIRLWLAMSELARQTNTNDFTRKEIKDALKRYNVKFSGRNLSRWLNIGLADARFWHYDTKTELYYPRGYESLSKLLVGMCEGRGLHALYLTNYPGQRRPMLINIASDNLLQFERNSYAAWVASRENLTISRQMLSTLWARAEGILRGWEIPTTVQAMANYAFCDEKNHDAIPRNEDGTWRRDVHRTTLNGRDVIAWQLPNSYSASVKQYAKKGQLRRAYVSMKRYIKVMKAAGVCEQGECIPGGSKPTTKLYHSSLKGARSSKALHGNRSCYAFLGRWGSRYGYYQYTPDAFDYFDFWQARRLFRRQQCVCFTKRALKIVGVKDTYIDPF